MKLHNPKADQPEFYASDLKDGQVAIVLDENYAGDIVQRYGNHLVTLGKPKGQGRSGFFDNDIPCLECRLLEPGELLEIDPQ